MAKGNLNPAAGTAKWKRNVQACGPSYVAGINAVTVSPMEQAASEQSQQLYKMRTAEAVDSGKMAARLRSVPMSVWKQAATTTGVQRLTAPTPQAEAKYQAFAQVFYPYVEQGAAAVRSMPKGGLSNAKARCNAMIDHNAAFKRF